MAGGLTATSFKSAQNNTYNLSGMSPNRDMNNRTSMMAKTSSCFNQTASSAFMMEGSLLGNLDSMTTEQLKERLLVSETLMKKLYNRNKDIELYHRQKLEKERKI